MVNRTAFFLILLFANFSFAQNNHQIKEKAQVPEWTSLLFVQYKTWLPGKPLSASDSDKFFVTSPNSSLEDELAASIKQLQEETASPQLINDKSFTCRFPARTQFIHQNFFPDKKIDFSKCTELAGWREKVAAESASIIFSSYYIGNPASLFGHTLLRLNNSGFNKKVRRDLLSYGINYGASPWTNNAVLYSFLGLIGEFPGTFSAIPYYYKVREYNDYESRDMWEYELNLTQEEVNKIIDILWEQKDNYFDYYFLSENCGYYIAALLQAAAPRFNIMDNLRKWVIPSDTIVNFKTVGLIKKTKYRPSIFSQFSNRYNLLTSEQKNIFEPMARSLDSKDSSWKPLLEKVDQNSQSQLLDTALDYYDYKNSDQLLEKENTSNVYKDQLLQKRSELPVSTPLNFKNIEENSPEYAHGSFRYQLSTLNKDFDSQYWVPLIGVRFGYHDLEDLQKGLPEGALIELADLGFSIRKNDNRHDLVGEKFKLVEIGSYPDYTQWSNKTSFYFKLGFERNTDKICSDCMNGQISFGAGLTKAHQNFRFSLLPVISYKHGEFQNEKSESFYNFLQLHSKAILQIDFNDYLQIRLENNYSLINSEKINLNEFTEVLRINTTKNISFEMSLHQNETQNFGAFSFYYYTF